MKAILRFAGCALLVALLAPAARPPSLTLSPEQGWALAASAILAQRNGDRHDLLGGRPRTPENIDYAADLLRSSWSVTDRDTLLTSMRILREVGYREYFDRLGKAAASHADDLGKDADERRRMEIAAAYYSKFGSKSILAWDYMRYISLCRWGYLAGYLPEKEAWNYILPVAKLLQQTFSSWQEMGRNFLVGREFWSPDDERKVETEYAYYHLLTDPKSPWRVHRWNRDLVDKSTASLNLVARPRGLTCLVLQVIDRPNAESLVPAVERALGCRLRVLSDKSVGSDRVLRAECNQKATGAQRQVTMQYRLEPLAVALRRLEVGQLFVFTGHYIAGRSEIFPTASAKWIRDGYLY